MCSSPGSAPTVASDPHPGVAPEVEHLTGENFPVALRALPGETRAHLLALYVYARRVDDLGDELDGDRLAALDEVDRDLDRLFAGEMPRDHAVRGLRETVRERGISKDPLRRLIQANRQDQQVDRYPTFEDLRAYCDLSANPVGQLVLEVFGAATPSRIRLSDEICTALQVLEHTQDIAEDRRRGRIYLPREDLDRFGLADDDLDAPTGDAFLRGLVAYETTRAGDLLDAGAPLVRTLHGWARLAIAGYIAGGRASARALRRAGYDPMPGPPKPRRLDTVLEMLRLLAVTP